MPTAAATTGIDFAAVAALVVGALALAGTFATSLLSLRAERLAREAKWREHMRVKYGKFLDIVAALENGTGNRDSLRLEFRELLHRFLLTAPNPVLEMLQAVDPDNPPKHDSEQFKQLVALMRQHAGP